MYVPIWVLMFYTELEILDTDSKYLIPLKKQKPKTKLEKMKTGIQNQKRNQKKKSR